MTVCDEWTRRNRRGVNVIHCTTEVSEEKEKRENEQGMQRRKEGMGVCGGGASVCVCKGERVVAHELHTKAPHALCPCVYVLLVRHAEHACAYACVCLCSCVRTGVCACMRVQGRGRLNLYS